MSKEEFWDYQLNLLETDGRDLTKWEEDFLSSLKEWRADKKPLSARQAEILDRIYTEKTP